MKPYGYQRMNLRIPMLGYILAVGCPSDSPRIALPNSTIAPRGGALDCHGERCCLALPIPMTPAAGQGRTYLDKYEVTVGRFRRFAATFTGYRDEFPGNLAELRQLLKCDELPTRKTHFLGKRMENAPPHAIPRNPVTDLFPCWLRRGKSHPQSVFVARESSANKQILRMNFCK